MSTNTPGTNASFFSLKQVDAGVHARVREIRRDLFEPWPQADPQRVDAPGLQPGYVGTRGGLIAAERHARGQQQLSAIQVRGGILQL